jgi:TrmH family RNA methyltransferase
VQRITSRHNERLREVARLVGSSRDRRKSGRCVLEGAHLIEVYCDCVGPPDTLIVVDEGVDDPEIARLIARVPPSHAFTISRALFSEIATLPPDVGALAAVEAPRPANVAPGDYCLLLDDVQDPGNVGSMIRTAAAAGVDQIVLSPHCAFAWSPKALRAGQGAHFLTTIIEDAELEDWAARFRASGGRVIATVVTGAANLYAVDLRGRVALAIGSEGRGLSAAVLALADARVTIPMARGCESLNAAAAAAVVLFEGLRQRSAEAPHPAFARHASRR